MITKNLRTIYVNRKTDSTCTNKHMNETYEDGKRLGVEKEWLAWKININVSKRY